MKKRIYLLLPLLLAAAALFLAFSLRTAPDSVLLLQEGEMSLRQYLAEDGEETGGVDGPAPSPYPDGLLDTLYGGLNAGEAEIGLAQYALDADLLRDAMQEIVNGSPELFFVSSKYTYSHLYGTVVSLKPRYLFEGEELENAKREYEEMLNGILLLADPSASPLEKVLFVNDYLCLNFSYDEETGWFDAYHFLKDGKGVCQSYTLTASALLQRLGIETTYAQSASMNHIWNLVCLDGTWYHLDITWNDPTPDVFGKASHRNFLLNDEDITAARHSGWTAPAGITAAEPSPALPFRSVAAPLYPFGGRYYYLSGGEIARMDAETGEVSYPFDLHSVAGLARSGEFLIASAGGTLYSVRIPEKEILPLTDVTGPEALHGFSGMVTFSDGTSAFISPALPAGEGAMYLWRDGVYLGTFASADGAFAAIREEGRTEASYRASAKLPEGVLLLTGDEPIPAVGSLCFFDSRVRAAGAAFSAAPLVFENAVLLSAGPSASLTAAGDVTVLTPSADLVFPVTAKNVYLLPADGQIRITAEITAEKAVLSGKATLAAPLTAKVLETLGPSSVILEEGARLVPDALMCADLTLSPLYLPEGGDFFGVVLDDADAIGSLTVRLPLLPERGSLLLPVGPDYEEKDAARVFFLLNGRDITPLFTADPALRGWVRSADTRLEIEGTTLVRCVTASERCEAFVPEGVTVIAKDAFSGIPGEVVICLPDSVQTVESHAIGYRKENGERTFVPERTTVCAAPGSAGALYAKGCGITCHDLYSASVSGFDAVIYPALGAARLTGSVQNDGDTVVIPTSLTAGGVTYEVRSVSDALFGDAEGLTVVTRLSPALIPDPWNDRYTVYAGGDWHIVTVVIDGTELSHPVAAEESPRKWLPALSRPAADGVRFLFRGYDLDGDGEPDPLPDTLEGDLRAEALFEAHSVPDTCSVLFLLPDGTLHDSETVRIGEAVLFPEDPASENGMIFTGWCGIEADGIVTKDTVLVAGFVPEEAEEELTSPILTVTDSLILLPSPVSSGYLLSCFDQKEGVSLGDRGIVTGGTVTYGNGAFKTIVLIGDLNGDGQITVTDYLILRTNLVGKREDEGIIRSAADMNGDGRITVTDVVRIRAEILGKTA